MWGLLTLSVYDVWTWWVNAPVWISIPLAWFALLIAWFAILEGLRMAGK